MGFSDHQIAALSAPLLRDHIKQREQAGRRFSYIEGWHCIAEANRIFGFDGWDREMVECRCVSERERKIGRPPYEKDGHQVGYVARIRIVIHAGERQIVREGSGYGSGIDVDIGAAHESAIKEAETDAMKRALMTFGNPFGLALYDKDQANVEAPARPSVSQPLPVQMPDPPAPRSLSQIRDGILRALDVSDTPSRVDGILRVHNEDIKLIKAASITSYSNIMVRAEARKRELSVAPEETLMGQP